MKKLLNDGRSLAVGCTLCLAWFGCTAPKTAMRDAPPVTQKTRTDATAPVAKKEAAPDGPQMPKIAPRAQLKFEDANKAFEAQKKAKSYDYARLERLYQDALEADPNLAEADYDLGVIAERQGKMDDAVRHYESAIKKRPSLKAAAENLAVIRQNRGDVAGAQHIYEDIARQFPEDASSRARLAEIYRASGDHEKAMEWARQALMREPKLIPAYKVMMLSLQDRKQFSMAKLVALRALKIDENDPELYHAIGLLLMRENENEKAQVQFKKALEVRPDYLPSRLELARLALRDENYAVAEQHLRKILQINGKSAEAHLDLGVAYKGMGQFDHALQEYDAAEALDPKLVAVYFDRAILLHHHKEAPERALELYKKYVSLASPPPEHQVFPLIKEAEQLIAVKAEAAKAEEEGKRQAEELKKKQQQDKEKAVPAKGAPPAGGGTPAAVAAPGEKDLQTPAADGPSGGKRKGSRKNKAPAAPAAEEPKDEPAGAM